jgi:hypothetical protein
MRCASDAAGSHQALAKVRTALANQAWDILSFQSGLQDVQAFHDHGLTNWFIPRNVNRAING